MSILDELINSAREQVVRDEAVLPRETLRERATSKAASLREALAAPGVGVIAEVKRASPSEGPIAGDLDAVKQADAYSAGGAAAISVLTEPSRFKGTLADLTAVAAVGHIALRKDFIVDEYQLWQAAAAGASAALLIVAALDDQELAQLHATGQACGLDLLVEAHNQREVERAVNCGAQIIGINARDLSDFTIDRTLFASMRSAIPDGILAVDESGITGPEDVARSGEDGADAVLVGTAAVRAADPAAFVAALVAAGRRDAHSSSVPPATKDVQ